MKSEFVMGRIKKHDMAERDSLKLPKSYGGSTIESWGGGCTARLHFTDTAEAEAWLERLLNPAALMPLDSVVQYEQALSLLAGLHPGLTIDEPPMDVALRIFDAVLAERSALQAKIKVMEKNLECLRRSGRSIRGTQ